MTDCVMRVVGLFVHHFLSFSSFVDLFSRGFSFPSEVPPPPPSQHDHIHAFCHTMASALTETMEQIQELSFGIVGEYREKQKGKLQRTFVSGSTAASKKVNRL